VLLATPVLAIDALIGLVLYATGDGADAVALFVVTVLLFGGAALVGVASVGALLWISRPIAYEPEAPPPFYGPEDR
jgi:hypothetical protein